MATNVHLTKSLERFARACVKSGRYNSVSEVVRSGLRLLQDAEDRRRQFARMLADVEAEVARDGTVSLNDALLEFDKAVRAERGR